MKKIFAKLALFSLFAFAFQISTAYAQIPQSINFQAIARDGFGNPMVNTNIQIRLSVLDSVQSGTIVYQELRALQTNAHGSFSFQIGVNPAFTTIGSFSAINWKTGDKHLKIDYDPTNTFTFSLTLGVIKFVTVPYAFAAQEVVFIDATGAQNGDVLMFNSLTGKFEPTSNTTATVDWVDVQNKPTNVSHFINDAGYISQETQVLSISNDTIFLTGGSFVKLPLPTQASLLPPTATVLAANNIQITTATSNGTVNANGLSSEVIFEWGLTTAYGNTATATQSPVTGTTDVAVSANLTGLQSSTTYHYRIKATNAVNVTYSSDIAFTTLAPVVPTLTTSNFSDIKGNSAKAGGAITNDGGSPITAQGLCWSTSANPTIADSTNTSFTDAMSGLTPNTTYYVRAYANNSAGTGYGNQISFNSGRIIGSLHAGGLVFYNDGVGGGLVCAETNQSTGAGWGCYGTNIGGTSTALFTGATNTNAIVAGCATIGIAARICYDLGLNIYSDWYLPSLDELNLMYTNLHTQSLGSFSSYFYWSSSEYHANLACNVNFSSGLTGNSIKNSSYIVRAVRSF